MFQTAGSGRGSGTVGLPAGCVCLAISVCVFFPPSFVPKSARVAESVLLIGLALLSLFCSSRDIRSIRWRLPLLILAYLGVSTIVTYSIGADDEAWSQFQRQCVLGFSFIILGLSVDRLSGLGAVAKTIVYLACFQSVFAFFEVLLNPSPLWYSPVPETWDVDFTRLRSELIVGVFRAQGTFGHPLFLAFFLALAFSVSIRLPGTARVPRILFSLTILTGIVCSGSRSALVISVLLIVLYLVRRFSITVGIGVVAFLGALYALSGFAKSQAVQTFFQSGSFSHRSNAIDALPLIVDQDFWRLFLGNGWYSRNLLFESGMMRTDGLYAVDNQVVSLLVASGLVGLFIFICVFWLGLRSDAPEFVKYGLLVVISMYFVIDVHDYSVPWSMLCLFIGLASAMWSTDTVSRASSIYRSADLDVSSRWRLELISANRR